MLGTAGLRVLAALEDRALFDDDENDDNSIFEQDDDDYGEGSVERIMIDLRNYIDLHTRLLFIRDDQVRVLRGEEEALFDFLTLQQLLRYNPYSHFSFPSTHQNDQNDENEVNDEPVLRIIEKQWSGSPFYPIITIDLGGASTQIAFALSSHVQMNVQSSSGTSGDLQNFPLLPPLFVTSSDDSALFVHSFLNYGVNRARESYFDWLIAKSKSPVSDPCMPMDLTEIITRGENLFELRGVYNYQKCKESVDKMFQANFPFADCADCAFTNTFIPLPTSSPSFQPSTNMTVVAFDHAYRIASRFGLHGRTPLAELKRSSLAFFSSDSLDNLRRQFGGDIKDDELRKLGFEITYLHSLMSLGYKLDQFDVVFGGDIEGYNLNWALGAAVEHLYLFCKLGAI